MNSAGLAGLVILAAAVSGAEARSELLLRLKQRKLFVLMCILPCSLWLRCLRSACLRRSVPWIVLAKALFIQRYYCTGLAGGTIGGVIVASKGMHPRGEEYFSLTLFPVVIPILLLVLFLSMWRRRRARRAQDVAYLQCVSTSALHCHD